MNHFKKQLSVGDEEFKMSHKFMNNRALSFIVVCGLMMSGCQSTLSVMNKKNSEQYIEVLQGDTTIDVENYLKESGNKYICKELYFGKGSSKNKRACYIKAPEESKLKQLGVKLLDVPEAILEDTGVAMLVIGKVVLVECMLIFRCKST